MIRGYDGDLDLDICKPRASGDDPDAGQHGVGVGG